LGADGTAGPARWNWAIAANMLSIRRPVAPRAPSGGLRKDLLRTNVLGWHQSAIGGGVDYCREGDTLVVTKLARSARHLSEFDKLEANGVALPILDFFTTSPAQRRSSDQAGGAGGGRSWVGLDVIADGKAGGALTSSSG
jgi:hypothetical protein